MRAVLALVDALNERLVGADCIGQALDIAGENDAPPWVYMYRQQIEAIRGAAEALETMLRKAPHVQPD